MLGGIVLVQMTSKIKKLLESMISVDLGTILEGFGRFPRRKIMIGVWPTQLDGFVVQLCNQIFLFENIMNIGNIEN